MPFLQIANCSDFRFIVVYSTHSLMVFSTAPQEIYGTVWLGARLPNMQIPSYRHLPFSTTRAQAIVDEGIDFVKDKSDQLVDSIARNLKNNKNDFLDSFKMDKPIDPMITSVIQRSGAPLCHAVGVEHGVRLSANPIHAARMDLNAKMNLLSVVQKPSVALVWDCNKDMTLPVHPLLGAPAIDETKLRSASFLSYCSVYHLLFGVVVLISECNLSHLCLLLIDFWLLMCLKLTKLLISKTCVKMKAI